MGKKELLPIGSVVLLKGATKRIMIFGRLQQEAGGEARIWDYVGCPYPEGNLGPEESILFDGDMIETLFFMGFQDPEEFMYRKELLAAYEAGGSCGTSS